MSFEHDDFNDYAELLESEELERLFDLEDYEQALKQVEGEASPLSESVDACPLFRQVEGLQQEQNENV